MLSYLQILKMWPELLDMTREESKRILRRVELEAYSSVVSAFRSQGDLSKDKKRILHDLQQMLRYVKRTEVDHFNHFFFS